ncbi:sodium:proton exchanger [Parasphingopyxis algicola]|uniref:cation:proton antiporter domain-containing protein n=1 Tax=Parasphingopyxis algicola TaxID=2026624 RepID=UPI00159F7279|nr:cation:proton antiporter [Parasphingopyxis algicola]QLC25039.1 sodium:proton exchanger [Parasphingopyxis algicola]
MEAEHLLAALALLFVGYGVLSRPLGATIAPAPLVFALAGLALSTAGLVSFTVDPGSDVLLLFAECTLALVLFGDASRLSLRKVIGMNIIAQRMLLIALPLAILFGALAALGLFPQMFWMEAALLAAMLAPTDAALGAAVVENEKVPLRVRRAIITESGLNDGLAVPPVLLFAALAGYVELGTHGDWAFWAGFAAQQIGFGVLAGVGTGLAGGFAIVSAARANWLDPRFETLACIGVAAGAFLAAEAIGGNAFVSAFIAGLSFAAICEERTGMVAEFVEQEGKFFSLTLFFVFGLGLAPIAIAEFQWVYLVYALLSLTVIRMGAVALSLIGTELRLPTIAYLGWFGPRGLATLVFVLLVFGEGVTNEPIRATACLAVLLSIILHGITAAPFAARYAHSKAAKADGKE